MHLSNLKSLTFFSIQQMECLYKHLRQVPWKTCLDLNTTIGVKNFQSHYNALIYINVVCRMVYGKL